MLGKKKIENANSMRIKSGNENIRVLLLVCSSDAVLVWIQKPIYIHATEAYIYYRQTVNG